MRFRILFYLTLVTVSLMAIAPGSGEELTVGWDKANHFIAFLALFFLFDRAYPQRRLPLDKFCVLLLYGALIEMVQAWVPGRDCSLLDLLADALGLLTYFVLRPVVAHLSTAIKQGAGSAD